MAPGSIVASVEDLEGRYRGSDLHARFRLRIGALVRDVVVTPDAALVEMPSGTPDATISTSPATWLELDSGHLSGIEAFASGRLTLRGSIQTALRFEPLFERPEGGATHYRVERVEVNGLGISTLIAGPTRAPVLLMLHGLGATKASLLPIVPELADCYRIVIPDLPGFGDSDKPLAPYDAVWLADRVIELMQHLGVASASILGNSMGGRIAQEIAIERPELVEALVCLCPATAFTHRPGLALVRLARPEFGMLLGGRLPRRQVIRVMKDLFARSERVDDSWFEAAADDFLRTWRSPRARHAFLAALRRIYLDEPYGERGFWERLGALSPPALYLYGAQDTLITPQFAQKVTRHLPRARVEVWDDCGHAPQIEHPQRTARTVFEFLDRSAIAAAG